ncbi:ABC transporter ATP-binding protein [Halobellus clavatus]|uniref:Branched-chain amino acid transport system ATP-binding protein n=1 Tax=Halobellus clavatus TaxID=660517 RepID=A0A1H3E7E0_9EURY|nr:ABC transporter ATP-binding protein [Halobellus clavatus]SDX74653.1 branched-chain amino acid transport system ATP-binding protein [Halobellus clavatus]
MSETETILAVEEISSSYGSGLVLEDVSLTVGKGEVVGLLGRNGAGKTTTLRSITGVIKPRSGKIEFRGQDITALSDHEISNLGISYVVEERAVFPDLTVEENLRMGGIKQPSGIMTIEEIFEWMPRLDERKELKASKLSGGEQQMLAIGRALRGKTELLLLDEPTEGLAPQIVEDVIDAIERIQEQDIPILVVEQNLNTIFEVADRVFILEQGRNVYEGTVAELRDDTETQQQYLGVGTNPDVEAFD